MYHIMVCWWTPFGTKLNTLCFTRVNWLLNYSGYVYHLLDILNLSNKLPVSLRIFIYCNTSIHCYHFTVTFLLWEGVANKIRKPIRNGFGISKYCYSNKKGGIVIMGHCYLILLYSHGQQNKILFLYKN